MASIGDRIGNRAFALALSAAGFAAGVLASNSAHAYVNIDSCAGGSFCTLAELTSPGFNSFKMNGATFSNFSFDGASGSNGALNIFDGPTISGINVSLADVLVTPIEQQVAGSGGFGFSLALSENGKAAFAAANVTVADFFLSYELKVSPETGGLTFAAGEFGVDDTSGSAADIGFLDPDDLTRSLADTVTAVTGTQIDDYVDGLRKTEDIFGVTVFNDIFLDVDAPFFLTQLFRTAAFISEPGSIALVLLALLALANGRRLRALPAAPQLAYATR